jgi:hypothetical protein
LIACAAAQVGTIRLKPVTSTDITAALRTSSARTPANSFPVIRTFRDIGSLTTGRLQFRRLDYPAFAEEDQVLLGVQPHQHKPALRV